jgi:hypothetical protein
MSRPGTGGLAGGELIDSGCRETRFLTIHQNLQVQSRAEIVNMTYQSGCVDDPAGQSRLHRSC